MRKIHLSPSGYEKYKQEWKELKLIEKPQVQEQVRLAAAEGDRSENAGYTFGKMRLRQIDQRLKKLDRIIDHAIIVEEVIQDGSIRFGATVTLKNLEGGKCQVYHLVGSEEVDAIHGFISMNSPIGKRLKGQREDQEIEIQSPRGIKKFKILKVEYLDE